MDETTTIAQGLYAIDERAQYDAACKRILSEKVILARIMKACLAEYQHCNVDDIAEKYIEGSPHVSDMPVLPDESDIISGLDTEDKSLHEGMITYDIRFRAIVPGSQQRIGLIINVEAQNDFYPGYPLIKRGIYYCSRMISSQYGREFTGSHYEKIKKVYSIWICMNPPKNRENTITRYRLTEQHLVGQAEEDTANYDLLSIIMLCLGKPDGENYNGILRLLDVLLSNDLKEAEKRRILQNDYQIPMTRKIDEEVSVMCNLSKGVWDKAMTQGMAQGIEKGLAEGLEKGMEKGITQGIAAGTLASLKNLIKNLNLPIDQAMDVLEIPEEDRQNYRQLLEQQ